MEELKQEVLEYIQDLVEITKKSTKPADADSQKDQILDLTIASLISEEVNERS